MSSALAPRERSFTGLLRPCKIGPIASNIPKRWAILYPMLPACKPGKTKTLACPATSLSGALIAAVAGTNAASNCNSPSIAKSGRISLAIFVA